MTIYFKQGDHYFLSNFHEEPFYMKGKLYKTAEHAYQASKSDNEIGNEWVRKAMSPRDAKIRGQSLIIRKDWEVFKLLVMKKIVTAKFSTPHMKKLLLDTDNEELVEYTYWNDRFWGVGKNYKGENNLGKILMEVRKELSLLSI